MEIVINDESVNRYGFRVLTKGIMLGAFRKNPVLLYNHQRSFEYDSKMLLPLGKWENIRETEGGKLVAEPVLDLEDEVAVSLKDKLENGYVNAASIGIRIIEYSEDPKLMLPGQTRPTVTKCELQEISLVDIPANPNCVKLQFQGLEVVFPSNDVELLNKIFKRKNMDKGLLALLGLGEDATENQIKEAVSAMKQAAEDGAKDLASEKEKQAKLLIESAKSAGKITDEQAPAYMKLALADLESTKSILDRLDGYTSVSAMLQGAREKQKGEGNNEKPELVAKYDDMAGKGTLVAFSRQHPEEFQKIQTAKVEYEREQLSMKGLYKTA